MRRTLKSSNMMTTDDISSYVTVIYVIFSWYFNRPLFCDPKDTFLIFLHIIITKIKNINLAHSCSHHILHIYNYNLRVIHISPRRDEIVYLHSVFPPFTRTRSDRQRLDRWFDWRIARFWQDAHTPFLWIPRWIRRMRHRNQWTSVSSSLLARSSRAKCLFCPYRIVAQWRAGIQ